MSPFLQQPLDFGVDVVIHSATKYLSGHADASGGILVTNDHQLREKIAFIQNAEGSAISPFEAWLILRGLKTLKIRIMEQEKNAQSIIEFLQTEKLIKDIYYPTLATHPNSKTHLKQSSGGGGIICVRTGDPIITEQIVKNLELFKYSVSFGSLNSTVNIPAKTSHLARNSDNRESIQDLIRFSIGIEDVQDLIDDLKNSFKNIKRIEK